MFLLKGRNKDLIIYSKKDFSFKEKKVGIVTASTQMGQQKNISALSKFEKQFAAYSCLANGMPPQ